MNGDLIELGEKLENVIGVNIEGINIFSEYLNDRVALEEQFVSQISSFINREYMTHSSALTLVLEEMSSVMKKHQLIAESLKKDFIPPITTFKNFVQRQQKEFSNTLTNIKDSVKAINKRLCIAKAQLDRANLESLHYSSVKGDKARRTVRSLETDLEAIKKEQYEKNKYIQEVQYPRLIDSVSELDFSVRTTLKNSILNLVHSELQANEISLDSLNTVLVSAERYEPSQETSKVIKALGFGSKQKKLFAVALCDFEGSDIGDLPMSRGMLVEITRQHPSGWWEGEAGGRKGIFPMTYVDPVSDITGGTFVIDENFEVDSLFQSTNEGDLSVDPGDVVHVFSVADGWCDGYDIATRKRGRFPSKVVHDLRHFRI